MHSNDDANANEWITPRLREARAGSAGGDAPTLIDAVREQAPEAVVVDVRMPPDRTDDGARAARQFRAEFQTLPIVLLSQHIDTRNCVELAQQGYFGYLLKDRVIEVEDFLDTLELV